VDEAMLRAGELQQIFERIAATAEKTDFGGDTLPILESVLGKAALTLAPALTTSLQDAAKEARSLGLVLEDALIDSLEGTGDELDKVVARLRGPLAAALGEILSKASDLATYVKLFAGSGITFMKETGSTLSPSAGAEAVRKHWNKTLEDWEVSKGLRAPDGAPDGEPARVKGLRARLQDETNGGKGDAAARTAEREQESIARAKERIFQIDLRSMAAAQKRVALEKHIGELMERREAMRKAGAPESEILEMEAKIKEAAIDHDGTFDEKGKPSLGDVSSLTQLGKLSARDQFVNADPVVPLNKMVDLVREQLNIDRQTLMVMNRLSEQQWARLRSSV
jgi:hypothetical protein